LKGQISTAASDRVGGQANRSTPDHIAKSRPLSFPWFASVRKMVQKCGFRIIGKNKDFANGRGEDTEEYILRLDL